LRVYPEIGYPPHTAYAERLSVGSAAWGELELLCISAELGRPILVHSTSTKNAAGYVHVVSHTKSSTNPLRVMQLKTKTRGVYHYGSLLGGAWPPLHPPEPDHDIALAEALAWAQYNMPASPGSPLVERDTGTDMAAGVFSNDMSLTDHSGAARPAPAEAMSTPAKAQGNAPPPLLESLISPLGMEGHGDVNADESGVPGSGEQGLTSQEWVVLDLDNSYGDIGKGWDLINDSCRSLPPF